MNSQGRSGPSDWTHHSFRHLAPISGESPLAWPRLVALSSRAPEVKQNQSYKYLGARKILCQGNCLNTIVCEGRETPGLFPSQAAFFFPQFIHTMLFPLLLN